jgi:ferredoxin
MSTTLYYFSATGNSLKFARDIAAELGDCRLVSIASALSGQLVPPVSECVGFVFPVFAWGLPRIVGDFLNQLSLQGTTYVFAIATCVAIPGNTLKEFEQRLHSRGARLHAGFAVKAQRSSLMKLNGFDRVIMALDRQRKRIRTGETRLREITETVKRREQHAAETSSWPANLFGSLLHAPALNTFKSVDSSFVVQDSCKGCGTCVKVCPRANIKLAGKRPAFEHNCEFVTPVSSGARASRFDTPALTQSRSNIATLP